MSNIITGTNQTFQSARAYGDRAIWVRLNGSDYLGTERVPLFDASGQWDVRTFAELYYIGGGTGDPADLNDTVDAIRAENPDWASKKVGDIVLVQTAMLQDYVMVGESGDSGPNGSTLYVMQVDESLFEAPPSGAWGWLAVAAAAAALLMFGKPKGRRSRRTRYFRL
jgi:hypothetical protein